MMVLTEPLSFEWDKGNRNKSLRKHKVTDQECEEVFFDADKKTYKDIIHSDNEARHILLGKTKLGRLLFIVFVMRHQKVRIISARDLNKKERFLYEKTAQTAKI